MNDIINKKYIGKSIPNISKIEQKWFQIKLGDIGGWGRGINIAKCRT